MSNTFNDIQQRVVDALTEEFSDALIEAYESCTHLYIRVEQTAVMDILKYLKEEQNFIYLTDIIGTDRYTSDERFEVIYNIMSLKDRERIFIKTRIEEEDPVLPSATGIWKSANWLEREVYDMYGVRFENHPDLRRIYMPEDFEYFPLRKEFPLLGIPGSIDLPNTTPDKE